MITRLKSMRESKFFFDNSQRIVLLNRKDNQNLTKIGEWLAQSLHEKLECKASIGVGSTCKDFNRIKESYKEALEAVRYGKLKGSNAIYFLMKKFISEADPGKLRRMKLRRFCFL